MAVIGYKVAGTVANVGTVNWGSSTDLRASAQGVAPVDGWITHLGARMGYDLGTPGTAALAAYEVSGASLTALVGQTDTIAIDTAMVSGSGGQNYEAAVTAATQVNAGTEYGVAIGARSGAINFGMGATGFPMHHNNWSGTFPDPYAADTVDTQTKQVAWIVYEANRAPTATDPGGLDGKVVTSTTPTLTVGFSDLDAAYGDEFGSWQIVVKDSLSATAGDSTKQAALPANKAVNAASWVTPALTTGETYTAEMTVWDMHDVASPTIIVTFTVSGQGDLTDLTLADIEGYVGADTVLNTTTPSLTGAWAHATSEATASYTLRVVNDATDAVVRAEETVAQVDAVGAVSIAWPSGWTPLSRGSTVYRIEVKATDAIGGKTDWVPSDPFLVNAAPNPPTVIAPTDAVVIAYPTLVSANSDPTDDASLLTVSHEVRPVGGSAVAATASHGGSGQFSSVTDGTQFPSYGEYQWRAVATDPWGLSTEGSWQAISYLAPPTVTAVSPVDAETLTSAFPTVTWTLNRVQTRYRITVREQGGARVYYLSWIVESAVGAHAIPVPLPNRTDYDLVIWAETTEGSTTELVVPFRLEYVSTEARTAEEQSLIATEGEARAVDEYDEIVIDGVSIPVRTVQRTDTSRFEGKVTFGDYTVDSDQIMSTWAQTAWSGGMNIDHHIEGATDSRFRWAKAWTQASRALSLPLKTTKISGHTHVAGSAADRSYIWGESDAASPRLNVIPLVMAQTGLATPPGVFYSAGKRLYFVDPATAPVLHVTLADEPWNTARFFDDPVDGTKQAIWIPLGDAGVQAYHAPTGTLHAPDTTVKPIALEVWDRKLFALVPGSFVGGGGGGGNLRYRNTVGAWSAATLGNAIPPDEVPRDLVRYFDRAGNPTICVLTNRQVWAYDIDADALTPLGLGPGTTVHFDARGFAMWRDDGLYATFGLGIVRLSTAGVITFMGLDRDDGYQVDAARQIESLTPAINGLLAHVAGADSAQRDLITWNEAGWHFVSRNDLPAFTDASVSHAVTRTVMTPWQDSEVIWTGISVSDPEATGAYELPLTYTVLPPGNHGPRRPIAGSVVTFDHEGEFYSGWFDAGMQNFFKAWSHVEVTLRDPEDGSSTPPGTVSVSYRTEDEPGTWHSLGVADEFGRNVFPINAVNGVDRGLMSSRIEILLTIRDTTGAVPLTDTPIIEALVLKFIKLAQHGSAWQAYVALSDYDTHRSVGPTQIDDFLSRLSSEGSAYGPFQEMIHLARTEDGWEERGRHRVRIAQWQRAEGTGKNPYGDGVLNIIEVKVNRTDAV